MIYYDCIYVIKTAELLYTVNICTLLKYNITFIKSDKLIASAFDKMNVGIYIANRTPEEKYSIFEMIN